jgi:LPXTG-motif cell wall-anchored protein
MNSDYNQFGQMNPWGTEMTRPGDLQMAKIFDAATQSALSHYSENLPNPQGLYFREVFEKDVAIAEAVRNKNILSNSSFNQGVTVGRGDRGGEIYYYLDDSMRDYAITYDKRFMQAISTAKKKIATKLLAANYKQRPNGTWAPRSYKMRSPSKGSQLHPGRNVSADKFSSHATGIIPSRTPAGESFTPSPDASAGTFPEIKADSTPTPTSTWLLYLAGAAAIGGGAFLLWRRKS